MKLGIRALVMLAVAAAGIALGAVPLGAQDQADAKNNFKTFCVKCHGPSGKGDGPAAATLSTKPRDLSDCTRMANISDVVEFNVVKDGGSAAKLSKDMPGFSEGLEDAEIKALVAYIRAFCAK